MDAQSAPQSLLISAAQLAAERAAARLLQMPGASPEELQWLTTALEKIAALAAALWIEQKGAPSRTELRVLLDPPHLDMEALQRRLSDTPIIAATLLRQLPEGTEAVRVSLAGRGQADAFDRLGCPSPKLLIACGVVALHQKVLRVPPNSKNTRALALCGALLAWAREQVEDPAPTPDARVSFWAGSLRAAREIFAAEAASEDSAGGLARWAVEVALPKQTNKGE
jgi:hypothetical protein